MMEQTMKLVVDTGAVRINVEDTDGNQLGMFQFNPSDSNIMDRYEAVVDFFNSVAFQEDANREQELAHVRKLCQEIREQFDYLLGYNVSEGLFNHCGPLTIVSNGDFYFEHVMDGIAGLIEQISSQRVQKKLDRARKAAAKRK